MRRTNLGLSISGFRVSNGLHVVFVPDGRATEVQVTMRYGVGSVDDPPGQEGMAHLVEHLMFQQIADGQSLFAKLEAIATYWNGFTHEDTTEFVERAPADKLDDLLAVEAARLTVACSTISDDVFKREREVVVNETYQHATSFALHTALNSLVYPVGHPYQRAAESDVSLRSITRQQACAFADRHYAMRDAVLVISGRVTETGLRHALERALPGVPSRTAEPRHAVPKLDARGSRERLVVPLHDPLVVLAWPLPSDPATRSIVLAMSELVTANVEARIKGRVAARQWGGDRAPAFVIIVERGGNETVDDVLAAVRAGVADLDKRFAPAEFENTRQHATHALFARFEDGAARDELLASHVEAGREAGDGLAREIQAIATVNYRMAREISSEAFDLDHARVVELEPAPGAVVASQAGWTAIQQPIHDAGQPRLASDAAEANRPADAVEPLDPFAGMQVSTLDNGLKVMLLPLSSVPAVEMRLVFATGSADESATQRGIARIAAYGAELAVTRSDLPWLYQFFVAGGDLQIETEPDHTTFAVHGLDMYVDYLLTGLAHKVRGARYDKIDRLLEVLRKRPAKPHGRADLGEAWNTAIFGADHPYAHAGWGDRQLAAIDGAAVARFHDEHFTPDNATLIIAGGFDPDLALAWVNYLFGDWHGHAVARTAPRAAVQPVSLTRTADRPQVGIEIVFQARDEARARPAQLVAAEMMNELVEDVRQQLGASYGVAARLDDARLAVQYSLTGMVEAPRAVEAVALVRDRLERLRAGNGELAALFVRARARVLVQQGAYASGSRALANRAEHALDLGRDLHAGVKVARAVRALVFDDVKAALGELDLTRAAILLTGPRAVTTAMFDALHRTPTIVE